MPNAMSMLPMKVWQWPVARTEPGHQNSGDEKDGIDEAVLVAECALVVAEIVAAVEEAGQLRAPADRRWLAGRRQCFRGWRFRHPMAHSARVGREGRESGDERFWNGVSGDFLRESII